jgi:hypothetical protein
MGRSFVIEPLYLASLFRMKIKIKFDLFKGTWDLLSTLLKRFAKMFLIFAF